MPYNPSTDLVGLWRSVSGGVEKSEMPGMDFVIAAMSRAGIMRTVTSQTAPTTNQATTAWFQPANPSYGNEGTLFLWDPKLSMYVPATPELFHGGSSGGGGDGGGDGGVPPVDADIAIISATAPTNPTAGMEWWNGSIMQVFDASAWKTVGPGATTGPVATTTRAFSLLQTSDLNIGATTWVIVPFNVAPSTDLYSGWNATTHVFKPTKAGVYEFFARGYMAAPAGGWSALNLLKNDQGTYNPANIESVCQTQLYGAGASYVVLGATGLSQMNGTTDFVRLWAYAQDGIYRNFGLPALQAYLLP